MHHALRLPTLNVLDAQMEAHTVTQMTKAHALRAQPVLLGKVRRLLALRPQILNVLDAQMEAHTVT
jgi:phage FluMu protein gp41